MIEHVWFDTSGTLYRETPEFEKAHNEYLYKIMASVTGESNLQKLQTRYSDLIERHGSNSAVFQALGMPADYWQKKFEEFDANSLLKPNAEIIYTLSQLKERMPISVFTNLRVSKLQDMLNHLDIPIDYFTHVLSAVDVCKPKPDPEGFHKMVELSGISPDSILYVGDKVNKDIKPAKRVGMMTCLVWSQSPEADFSISSFPELLRVV
jgi:HAD superfamily hydrolase (TIGR01549 family)